MSHFEDPTLPYITSIAPPDRDAAQGYAGYPSEGVGGAGEVLDVQGTMTPEVTKDYARGVKFMRWQIHSVYHMSVAMWAGRDFGVGMSLAKGPYVDGWDFSVMHFAYHVSLRTTQPGDLWLFGKDKVATCPSEGVTNVSPKFAPASETPILFQKFRTSAFTSGLPFL